SFLMQPRAIEAVPNPSSAPLRKMRTGRSSRLLWAAALVSIGLFAGGARATFYDEQYEMTFSPETAAGTLYGNTLTPDTGTGTQGPSGSVFSGGIMNFLDDAASSS